MSSVVDRRAFFLDAVVSRTGVARPYQCYGVSNSLQVLEGIVRFGVPNLDNFSSTSSKLVVLTQHSPFPGLEVHLAIEVQEGVGPLLTWLETMAKKGGEYSDKNNNVAIFLGNDGLLRFHNRGKDTEDVARVLSQAGPGIPCDRFYFAVHAPTQGRHSEVVNVSVGEITRLFTKSRVQELRPFRGNLATAFDRVCGLCEAYNARPSALAQDSPEGKALMANLETIQAWADDVFGVFSGVPISVKAGAGFGNLARVPYVCLLPPGQEVSNGVYAAVCFGREGAGAVAGCAESATNPRPGFRRTRRTGSSLRVDVDGASPATRYNDVFQNPMEILRKDFDEDSFERHLGESLGLCLKELNGGPPRPATAPSRTGIKAVLPREDLTAVVESFSKALLESHISFGSYHADIVRAFIASIAAKRFVILTGLSGSGKTQLAIRFGEWLGGDQHLVTPVRPDWTGAEALFGYEDALREPVGGRRAWEVPAPLKFMLQAAANPTVPYLLVLDEMNLAHVERYFADVLSGMESEYRTLPNLVLKDGTWRIADGEEERIPVPTNLIVVGTVNVDETTYMFSPKVLDRANTFEFRVETGDLERGHQKPTPLNGGPPELTAGLIAISKSDHWHIDYPAPGEAVFEEHLRSLHQLLAEGGLEFGHRLFYEAVRFAAMYAHAGDPDPVRALDCQVMQKVLPRLHGSRRRLEPTMCSLGTFCHNLELVAHVADTEKIRAFDKASAAGTPALLPRSFEKVTRFVRSLRLNQFASFSE